MAAILTVPTKIAPFPYGATALAAYTSIAAVAFDEAAPGLSLDPVLLETRPAVPGLETSSAY